MAVEGGVGIKKEQRLFALSPFRFIQTCHAGGFNKSAEGGGVGGPCVAKVLTYSDYTPIVEVGVAATVTLFPHIEHNRAVGELYHRTLKCVVEGGIGGVPALSVVFAPGDGGEWGAVVFTALGREYLPADYAERHRKNFAQISVYGGRLPFYS